MTLSDTAGTQAGIAASDRQSVRAVGPAGSAGAASGPDGADRGRGILFRQVLLERRNVIGLLAPATAIYAISQSGPAALGVVLPATLQVYDVSDPLFPLMLYAWPAHGVTGVVSFAGSLWAWGDTGIRMLSADYLVAARPFTRCERNPVLSAAVASGFLYLLRNNGIGIYDRGLCEVGQVEIEGCSLASAGQALAVATPDGVVIFDLVEPRKPCRAACFELSNAGHLTTPSVFGARAVIAVCHPEGDRLLDISNPAEPFEALRFNGSAWYADTAQVGRVSASFNENRNAVVLHSIVKAGRF